MMIWFGLRPGLKMLLAAPAAEAATALAASDGAAPALGALKPNQNLLIASDSGRDEFLEALMARRDNGPERKLLKLVEFDEGQAAAILKQWIRQGAKG
jgi:flagellar M-ring protein FliF